jgi:alanine-synthesizing transaminase
MSKTYSMPGWRIGFAVEMSAHFRVRPGQIYLDYGAFTPVRLQRRPLGGPDDCIHECARSKAAARRLVESFGRAGWDVPPPRASMFAWAPIPEPFKPLGSIEFATLLVEKAEVAVSPGIGFGEYGEGFVRIALVENEQRIRQAARNIKRFLESRKSCTTFFPGQARLNLRGFHAGRRSRALMVAPR